IGALLLRAAIAPSAKVGSFSRRARMSAPRSAAGAYSNTTGKNSAVPIDSTAAVGFVSIDRTRSRSSRARRHCAASMPRSIRSCAARDVTGKSRSSDSRAPWKNRSLRAVPSGEKSSSSPSRSTSAPVAGSRCRCRPASVAAGGERASASRVKPSANAAKPAVFPEAGLSFAACAAGGGMPSTDAVLRAQAAAARPAAHRARRSTGCAGRRAACDAIAIEGLRSRRPILSESALTEPPRAARMNPGQSSGGREDMIDEERIERAVDLLKRAYERQRAGRLDDAVRLYKASIAEYATAEAHTFLGWTYSFQGRYEEAIEQCKLAITVDPNFGNPYNDIGSYLIHLGRIDQAIPWLEQAKRAPRYEPRHFPYLNLYRAYVKMGQIDKAQRELQQALFIQQTLGQQLGVVEEEETG